MDRIFLNLKFYLNNGFQKIILIYSLNSRSSAFQMNTVVLVGYSVPRAIGVAATAGRSVLPSLRSGLSSNSSLPPAFFLSLNFFVSVIYKLSRKCVQHSASKCIICRFLTQNNRLLWNNLMERIMHVLLND
jgi:hypothetical protein